MSALTDEACNLINRASADERQIMLAYLRERVPLHPLEQKWNTTADSILTAIERSSDLTHRGMRGILAEEYFKKSALLDAEAAGWKTAEIIGDQSYDFLIERPGTQVKIQVKLQRSIGGIPLEYTQFQRKSLNCPEGSLHVVEIQRTRGGKRGGEQTRPYRFGEFDILGVNLHPVTGDWKRFAFSVGSWLLPRPGKPNLIKTMQPVNTTPDDYWTDDLNQCIGWFLAGKQRLLYS